MRLKISKFNYSVAGHIITGNLKIISIFQNLSHSFYGSKYRFPSHIDLKKCREEIASTLYDYGDRWCKREHIEPYALKAWKVSIFKIVDKG